MNIQDWFDNSGSYADGVKLYALLPNCSNLMLKSFRVENFSNSLQLKYELKRALNSGFNPKLSEITEISEKPEIKEVPQQKISHEDLAKQSERTEFPKETMAMYPMELHSVYRERISNFYKACELKMKLNSLQPSQEKEALGLILQIEKLWDLIDRAWMVLEHWKDTARIMPFSESVDFSKYSAVQLVNEKSLMEVRISKRQKTLDKIYADLEANPEDRLKANQYNKKKEELEQLKIDLETIKKLLKDG